MKCRILVIVCLLAIGASAVSPTIVPASVAFSRTSPMVTVVEYCLADGPAIVTCDILTNGVSVGVEALTNLTGDVNCLVTTRSGEITWVPGAELSNVTAVVTARPVSAPPDYLCVDLRTGAHSYYTSSNAVPGGVTADVYKTDKMLLRLMHAAGITWQMGSPTTEPDRENTRQGTETPHLVTLSEDYYIGVYTLTKRQYQNIADATYRSNVPAPVFSDEMIPQDISYVALRGTPQNDGTWDWPGDGHRIDESKVLGQMRQASYLDIDFDLPTSAQWEFACRAGTTGVTYDDATALTNLAWTSDISESTSHPVGLKKPNPWGLYDMLGNVMEFVLDKDASAQNPVSDGSPVLDPMGPKDYSTEGCRVLRGGCFSFGAKHNRCAWQHDVGQGTGDQYRGARLCCPASLKFRGL